MRALEPKAFRFLPPKTKHLDKFTTRACGYKKFKDPGHTGLHDKIYHLPPRNRVLLSLRVSLWRTALYILPISDHIQTRPHRHGLPIALARADVYIRVTLAIRTAWPWPCNEISHWCSSECWKICELCFSKLKLKWMAMALQWNIPLVQQWVLKNLWALF